MGQFDDVGGAEDDVLGGGTPFLGGRGGKQPGVAVHRVERRVLGGGGRVGGVRGSDGESSRPRAVKPNLGVRLLLKLLGRIMVHVPDGVVVRTRGPFFIFSTCTVVRVERPAQDIIAGNSQVQNLREVARVVTDKIPTGPSRNLAVKQIEPLGAVPVVEVDSRRGAEELAVGRVELELDLGSKGVGKVEVLEGEDGGEGAGRDERLVFLIAGTGKDEVDFVSTVIEVFGALLEGHLGSDSGG